MFYQVGGSTLPAASRDIAFVLINDATLSTMDHADIDERTSKNDEE